MLTKKLTLTIPAYLHEEIICRAQSAKRCMMSELVAQLEGSLSTHPPIPNFNEVSKIKLLLMSKDFSRRSSILMPANLHQKLKIASAATRQSMSVELTYRVQQSYRSQNQISLHAVADTGRAL